MRCYSRPVALAAASGLAGTLTLSSLVWAQSGETQKTIKLATTDTTLPAIEVKSDGKAKRGKPKTGTKSPAPEEALDSTQTGESQATADNKQGAFTGKPGLNLESPASTGSRLDISPLETAASIEVVPAQTIRDRGQQSVNQAVTQNAAGFSSVAEQGNGGTGLAARGFRGHGSIMQLYDGTRLYVGAGTVTFPFDTWSTDRIEVLRGPASVMYGEGAIGGVINVIPKKPTDFFTHEAEVALGTNGTRRIGLGSGGPINERLSYRFDVSGIQSEGWLDQESDFSSLAVSGALRYRASSTLDFTLSHDHGTQSPLRYWGTPLIDGVITDQARRTNFNVTDSDITYRDNWTEFKTEWQATDAITLRNTAYRLTSDRHWRNVEAYDYQESGLNAGLVRRSDYIEIFHDQEQIGNRFDAAVKSAAFGMKNELVVGFDVNRIDFRHTNNSPYGGESFVDPDNVTSGSFINLAGTLPKYDTSTHQYSVFAEDRLTVTKEVALVVGIRLDRPTVERVDLLTGQSFEKEFSDVTWRTGAVVTPVAGLAFYGQYATGVDPVGGLITLAQSNAQFDLATGRQIEIGVKQTLWGGRAEWTLAGYDIVKRDLLARDPNSSQVVVQVGQQSSRGIEASLALQLTDTLRYEGNVALLEAQYDDFVQRVNGAAVNLAGNRPNNVPEQIVNSWLTWAFLPAWEARIGLNWVGTTFSDDINLMKRPDFTVVNLGLDHKLTETSVLSLRGFNVFDEVYATSGNSTEWTLAPPRSAEISYRIKY